MGWCYISIRSSRITRSARIEDFLVREVNDVELVSPAGPNVDHANAKRRNGASQKEIDGTLCSFEMRPTTRQHDRSRCDVRRGADRSWKLLNCLVCGKKEYLTLCIAETCSICLSDIEDTVDDQLQQQIRVLPDCGHGMHERSLQCVKAFVKGKA